MGEVHETGKREIMKDTIDHSQLDQLDNSQQVSSSNIILGCVEVPH